MNNKRKHSVYYIKYGKEKIAIDRKIAPLIRRLWELNIKTYNSCQAGCGGWCHRSHPYLKTDKDGYAIYKSNKICNSSIWISFPSVKEAKKFASLILKISENKKCYNLNKRILGKDYTNSKVWIWNTNLFGSKTHTSVIFPQSDLKNITNLIAQK